MVMLYNFNEVKAFALIAFNNWNNSANRENTSLKNFMMFLEPLEIVHKNDNVIRYANKLIKNEIEKEKRKIEQVNMKRKIK